MMCRALWISVVCGFEIMAIAQPLYYQKTLAGDTFVAYQPIPKVGPFFYERTFCVPLDRLFAWNPHLASRWDTLAWRRANPFVKHLTIDSALRKYPQWAHRWTIRYFQGIPQQSIIWINASVLDSCSQLPDSLAPFHVVRKGDTWYGLAQAYQISIDSLRLLNPRLADEVLVVGVRVWRVRPINLAPISLPLALPDSSVGVGTVSNGNTFPNRPRFIDTLEGKATWISPPDSMSHDPLVILYGGVQRGTKVWIESINTGRTVQAKVVAPPPMDASAEVMVSGRLAALLGEQRPFFRVRIMIPQQ